MPQSYLTMKTLQYLCLLSIAVLVLVPSSSRSDNKAKPKKKLPKDPLFITDVDLENLYDEWEESDDDKLPPDELPPHKRPAPKFELPEGGKEDDIFKDPERLMQQSKKGKTVMAFASVANNPTKDETEILTQRWQVGLTNNHIKCERYVIADDRAIFVFHDGLQAFEAKDFFLDQPELKEYSIDQRTWHGKGYPVEYPHSKGGDAAGHKVPDQADAEKKVTSNKSQTKRDEL